MAPAAPPVPAGQPGDMNFQLQRLHQPLTLRQVARDPTWDFFKTVMVVIGGLLFFYVYGEKIYFWGKANGPAQPTAVSQPAPVAPPTIIYSPEVPERPRPSTAEERAGEFWDSVLRTEP